VLDEVSRPFLVCQVAAVLAEGGYALLLCLPVIREVGMLVVVPVVVVVVVSVVVFNSSLQSLRLPPAVSTSSRLDRYNVMRGG
jgi:hypothetical protein